jgi:hypothetical protein
MMMETMIQFPDVANLAVQVSARFPDDLDQGISDLGDAFASVEVGGEHPSIPHITIEMRHWLNAFQDVVLEARTALVMWICYTDLLSDLPLSPDTFEQKVQLDRARNYFANDAAVRLATAVEHLAQFLNRVYNLGVPEADTRLADRVITKLRDQPGGTSYEKLYERSYFVRQDLRNAFVHRTSPIMYHNRWEEVTTDEGLVLYLASGRPAVRISEALRICQESFQTLSELGSKILTEVAGKVPELIATEVLNREQ